jgi:hypothetical protein
MGSPNKGSQPPPPQPPSSGGGSGGGGGGSSTGGSGTTGGGGGGGGAQPPPPDPDGRDDHDDGPGHGHDHHHDHEELQAQLTEITRVLAQILEETRTERLRKRLEYVPVRTSDLMRGFQAAVARANRATQAGEGEGEDIERMSIKDLQVTLSAPIIDGGHADDPVVMLPNIKSVDAESAKITLSFQVVSVPLKGRG